MTTLSISSFPGQTFAPTRSREEILASQLASWEKELSSDQEMVNLLRAATAGDIGSMDPKAISSIGNLELRSALIETYGFQRFMEELGYEVEVEDPWGKLIVMKSPPPSGPNVRGVLVRNSTAEPDGTFKDYILHVPPGMERPRQAIAWTFGLEEEDYAPELET